MDEYPPLSSGAKIALLILAANGGSMDGDDWRREFDRVIALPPEEFKLWRERAIPLAQMHAKRARGEKE